MWEYKQSFKAFCSLCNNRSNVLAVNSIDEQAANRWRESWMWRGGFTLWLRSSDVKVCFRLRAIVQIGYKPAPEPNCHV